MSVIAQQNFVTDYLVKGFQDLSFAEKHIFLERYAAIGEDSCPTGNELTQLFVDAANDLSLPIKTRELAFSLSQANPFSSKSMVPIVPVTGRSVIIPDSYIGETYGHQAGLFLGYFDLKDGGDTQPIFVLKLTDSMKIDQAVAATGELENGYKADILTYNAKKGLQEGQIVIASLNIVQKVSKKKNKGGFKKMFKDVGCVLSSDLISGNPHRARVFDFKHSTVVWHSKPNSCAPCLLVCAGLNL